VSFLTEVLLYQLGQDFVLLGQPIFEAGHLPVQYRTGSGGPALKYGGAALEELLLPGVEDGRLKVVLAEATLDRLLNRSHHLLLEGRSYRPMLRPDRRSSLAKENEPE